MIKVKPEDNFKYKFYLESIGYILIEDMNDTINIVDVLIEEKYRNKGYASKLFEYLFNYYKDRNVRYMLEVRIDNKIAIHLYEKHNFKIIHTRKKYYNGIDALIMERK